MKSISPIRRTTAAVAAVSLLLQPLAPVYAANNTNSSISGVNVVNLAANVDWDYDTTAPTQVGGSVALTKDVIRNRILRETARSVFLMTEGRHRVGTIYVYKNANHNTNVDIQILNKSGRSNAAVAGWQNSGALTSTNFLAIDGTPYDLRTYARIVAHELGHYVYGFLDEYRDDSATAKPSLDGGPGSTDFTRTSIMQYADFTRLTTADDYTGTAAQNNTAQSRGYATDRTNLRGGSHWEMLTRDPALDPDVGKSEHGGRRVFFDAFKGVVAPATLAAESRYFGVFCDPGLVPSGACASDASRDQLVPVSDRIATPADYNAKLFAKSGGTGGADAVDGASGTAFENFRVVFADSPNPEALTLQDTPRVQRAGVRRMALARAAGQASAATSHHVLVLDRTLPADAFVQAQTTAAHLLERAAAGSQWAVLLAPATTPAVPMTSIDTGRALLIAAVNGATRASGTLDVAAVYATSAPLLAAGRGVADNAAIELFTAQGTTVASSIGDVARQARVTVNAVGFMLPAGSATSTVAGGVALETLAQKSGGTLIIARNAEQASKATQRVQQEDAGENFALLATDVADTVPAGTQATSFRVSRYDTTIGVQWTFEPADRAKLQFRVVTPAGTIGTLSPDSDLADGYALIELDNSTGRFNGMLRAEAVASSAVTNPVSIDVESASDILMTASVEGGTRADNRTPVLRVHLASMFPVAKATVTANVHRASDGVIVAGNVTLHDDGVGVDSRADDGTYSASLGALLPAGDYYVTFQALTTDTSVFQPNQRFSVGGPDVALTLVGAGVGRAAEVDVTLEVGATGVLAPVSIGGSGAASTTPAASGGGGCTVAPGQQDFSLLLLLAVAVLGLRRARRARD